MTKMTRGRMMAAESKWRKECAASSKRDHEAKVSEFTHDRFSGAGLLGRALDTMSQCYNPSQRISFSPPKPRDGAGKPLFGRYRGAR